MSNDDEFEWDEDKNQSNLIKHKIDFQEAISIFKLGTARLYATSNVYGERRGLYLGELENLLIILVVTVERENRLRVISARRASRKERRVYSGNQEN